MKDAFFIINPISGKGLKDNIIAELEKQGFRYGITQYAGHAEKLARECAEPIVFAVGGDGTVNEVGRGLLGSDKVLGILPCGSGDGLARCLGISHRITRAISLAENGRQLPLDVGYINGKPFFSVCGVGFDADVSKRFAESGRRGVITYIEEAYKLWRTFKPAQFSISIDGRQWSQEAVLITVGNSNQWGNEAKVTPHADISDGILDITVLDMFHNIELPHLATMLMVGNCDASSRVHCYRGKSIVIERETDGAVHFDGDWFITGRRIEIDIHPAELKVLAP
ncbi:MAG: diacylglycerol kinase family lipid kinase [Bacteroidales bacterium]|nr:diacylglycerol kinase family lipid kinase [Bacteroidales bacterium]MDD6772643.1 diacylglycerol kinase family lipid kinase [Bacteroidales bacterium]